MKKNTLLLSGMIVLTIALLLNIALDQQVSAQQLRFGFVNSSVIMTQFEEAQRVSRQLETLASDWENELRQKIQNLQEKYEDFQRKQGMMTEQARIEEQQSLFELEQEINQFQREKFQQPGGEFFVEQERLFRPVREKILGAIEAIAQQENLNFVLDKTDDVPVLLYAESRYDITFKVLDYLKRGSN
jgi:outer membrane protein